MSHTVAEFVEGAKLERAVWTLSITEKCYDNIMDLIILCYLSWSEAQFAGGLGLSVRNLPEDKVELLVSLRLLGLSLRSGVQCQCRPRLS